MTLLPQNGQHTHFTSLCFYFLCLRKIAARLVASLFCYVLCLRADCTCTMRVCAFAFHTRIYVTLRKRVRGYVGLPTCAARKRKNVRLVATHKNVHARSLKYFPQPSTDQHPLHHLRPHTSQADARGLWSQGSEDQEFWRSFFLKFFVGGFAIPSAQIFCV
jgi:hypothetical protein